MTQLVKEMLVIDTDKEPLRSWLLQNELVREKWSNI